jgi:CRP-like cAMP-binding protein
MSDPARSEDLRRFAGRLLIDPSRLEAEDLLSLPASVVRVPPYRGVALAGTSGRQVGFVLEGMVARHVQFRDGNRLVTALHLPGDLLGLEAVLNPAAEVAADALTAATILQVPARGLRDAAREHPRIAEALWRCSAADAAMAREWLVNIGGRPAEKRLAHLLCEMACRLDGQPPAGPCAFRFPIAQTHIGDMLSLTSVHVNRVLKRLQAQGLVSIRRPLVTIPSWEALAAHAGFNPAYLSLARPGGGAGRTAPAAQVNGAAIAL